MMQAGSTTQSECACCVRSFSWLKGISLREKSCCMKTEALCCFFNVIQIMLLDLVVKSSFSTVLLQVQDMGLWMCVSTEWNFTKEIKGVYTLVFNQAVLFHLDFATHLVLIMYACLPLCRMKPWMLQQPGGIDRFKGSCQVVIRRSWRNLLSSAHAYHASLVKCKKNMYG